jgi:hypothetical protein
LSHEPNANCNKKTKNLGTDMKPITRIATGIMAAVLLATLAACSPGTKSEVANDAEKSTAGVTLKSGDCVRLKSSQETSGVVMRSYRSNKGTDVLDVLFISKQTPPTEIQRMKTSMFEQVDCPVEPPTATVNKPKIGN